MSTNDISDAVSAINDRWEQIKNDYFAKMPGKYLRITCVYRSPEEQLELYKKGRILGESGKWYVQDKAKIVTNCDGTVYKSQHNYKPSRAIDVMVVDNTTGKETWDEKYYYPLIEIAKRYGLESGGAWKSIKDWPHLQVPKDYVEA